MKLDLKHAIGAKAFFLKDNKVVEGVVCGIKVNIFFTHEGKEQKTVVYGFEQLSLNSYRHTVEEELTFKNKALLLKSL